MDRDRSTGQVLLDGVAGKMDRLRKARAIFDRYLPPNSNNIVCHWHKEINGPGIRRTDMDVTPRGSQFIDYDVPCDVLSTNGAILQHRPPSVRAWIRQPVAVRETEPTILMGGYCASVARTFAPADKQTKYGSSISSTTFLRPPVSQN